MSSINANMSGAHITNSSIAVGTNNVVIHDLSSSGNIPWDDVEDGLIAALSKVNKCSAEYKAMKEALFKARQKNEQDFIAFLKANAPVFLGDVVKNALGSGIAGLVVALITTSV